jgi:hypothetical protein
MKSLVVYKDNLTVSNRVNSLSNHVCNLSILPVAEVDVDDVVEVTVVDGSRYEMLI